MKIDIEYADLDVLLERYQETQEDKLTRNEVKFLKSVLYALAELSNEKNKRVRFILDGCDISFGAEAPANMTLEQLLKQCDRIKPDWCACGIRSYNPDSDYSQIELLFDYNNVRKTDNNVPCTIKPKEK